jgi:nucleoside-diphosphate-sugar epimerase
MSRRLFCFGLGYSALALAHVLKGEGWQIGGTVREPDRVSALERDGIEAVVFDGASPMSGLDAILEQGSALLISIPPGEDGDRVIVQHGAALAAHAGKIPWVGYLSTTGVYGDRGGDWVDEEGGYAPTTRRGRLRVKAEEQWTALWREHKLPVHLFRLAGIYGPGRNQLAQVKRGRARSVIKPGQVFSRIHVDDIVQVLRASITKPNPGAAYNLCDDEAAPPQDVVAYAAALLGMEPPPRVPIEEADMTEMAASFYAENKRVRNDRIKTELGVALIYPDYRSGLDALFAAGAY